MSTTALLAHDVSQYGLAEMNCGDYKCVFNLPRALVSHHDAHGHETEQSLPPYAQQPAFAVADFADHCPQEWPRGTPTESSYFVPVAAGRGIWLDFNTNTGLTHDVAVIVSVQGINAVSGLPTVGEVPTLAQYREKCPLHDVAFEADLYCPTCTFKWPPQNYLATTGTPHGLFWLDGFRAQDGVVRQYVFTKETARGVAAGLIGDRRVFAIGVAFFRSKNPKPPPLRRERGMRYYSSVDELDCLSVSHQPTSYKWRYGTVRRASLQPTLQSLEPQRERLEVAAGARIKQHVYKDPQNLDYWDEKPTGIILVNYCDTDTVSRIVAQGKRDRIAGGDGFMAGLPVGNPPHKPFGK